MKAEARRVKKVSAKLTMK